MTGAAKLAPQQVIDSARRVLAIEAQAVAALDGRIDASFVRAVEIMYA
jgi:hypothetical protein